MKKSNAFLWSVQSYRQSEMFLSNSVDVMKNLLVELQNKKILVRLFYVFHSFVYCAVDLAYYLLEEDPGQHNSILCA